MNVRTLLTSAALLVAPALTCQAQTHHILHSFKGGKDGSFPLPGSGAGFTADAAGDLYGVTAYGGLTAGYGTIFELSPPASGSSWLKSVLYRFKGGNDGDFPVGNLLSDGKGGFYSTTFEGGTGTCAPTGTAAGCGTAFHLTPPAAPGGAWKETVIYRFPGGAAGASPAAGLVSDASGALYGMTFAGGTGTCVSGYGCGTIYRLSPPAKGSKSWTETVLYAFTGGADGATPGYLSIDAAGNLYGETSYGGDMPCAGGIGCGVVLKLSPPVVGQTSWTETVLYTFQGGADGAFPQVPPVAFGTMGALIGTATNGGVQACNGGCGTVYELTPPKKGQSAWGFSVLYALKSAPDGAFFNTSLTPDGTGGYVTSTLYGGTGSCAFTNQPAGCGAVVKLSPPATKTGNWKESVLYSLPDAAAGALAGSPLLVNTAGVIYGATFSGGDLKACGGGCGVAFSLTP